MVPAADLVIKVVSMLREVPVLLFAPSLLSFLSVPGQNTANPALVESIGKLEGWLSLCSCCLQCSEKGTASITISCTVKYLSSF